MRVWRGFRVALILASLFMMLLIIVYWDDIGGFNFYPRKHSKHETLHAECCNRMMVGQSHFESNNSRPTTTPIAASTAPIPDQERAEKQQNKDKPEQMRKKTLEEEEPESTAFSVADKEQEIRKQRVMDVCSGKNLLEFPGRTQAFEQIPNKELDHLIVDDTHQVIYCYVPKVACTNWKRVMVVLSQSLISPSSGKPYTDPGAIPHEVVHKTSLHLTFAKFQHHYGSLSRHLMAAKLQHYTKFLFVRDPFVRLISAFSDKLGRPNEQFYKIAGSFILRRYGNLSEALPKTAAKAFAAGIKPTFHQFIKYLIDPETEGKIVYDEHWRQLIAEEENTEVATVAKFMRLQKENQLMSDITPEHMAQHLHEESQNTFSVQVLDFQPEPYDDVEPFLSMAKRERQHEDEGRSAGCPKAARAHASGV